MIGSHSLPEANAATALPVELQDQGLIFLPQHLKERGNLPSTEVPAGSQQFPAI